MYVRVRYSRQVILNSFTDICNGFFFRPALRPASGRAGQDMLYPSSDALITTVYLILIFLEFL